MATWRMLSAENEDNGLPSIMEAFLMQCWLRSRSPGCRNSLSGTIFGNDITAVWNYPT